MSRLQPPRRALATCSCGYTQPVSIPLNRPGQTAPVPGAAGGVGSLAGHLAHTAGARVIGTGHGWAQDLVVELGADQFIDMTSERFEESVTSVDVVLDLVGGDVLNRSLKV